MKPLRCTYCDSQINVNLEWEGRPYLQYQVVEGFECDNLRCGTMWDKDGNVTYESKLLN